jgi:hypothetical protein
MDIKSAIVLANAIQTLGSASVTMTSLRHGLSRVRKVAPFAFRFMRLGYLVSWKGKAASISCPKLGEHPNRMPEAKARAFLAVPLYKAVYEKYKGGVLPPAAALERDLVALGVAEKQKGRAGQVFERSAEQAGLL